MEFDKNLIAYLSYVFFKNENKYNMEQNVFLFGSSVFVTYKYLFDKKVPQSTVYNNTSFKSKSIALSGFPKRVAHMAAIG